MALTIEVEPERVDAALAKAARRIAGQANIPGFRKGKAPRDIVERMFGRDALLQEALDDLGQQVYREALKQANIEPYGPGQMEDIQQEPLVLKMVVPLAPVVDLGDYRSLRVPFEVAEVKDSDIDQQIGHLRERHAIIEPAPEGTPADWDHLVTLKIESTVEGRPFFSRQDASLVLEKEHLDGVIPVVPGFEEQVIGMKAGDERTFGLPVPASTDEADYGDFAGKTAEFKVSLQEIRLRTLPDVDDALAQTVGDFETLDALRDAIRQNIADANRREAESAYVDRVLDELLKTARIVFPSLMIDEELDEMLERTDKRVRDLGVSMDDYLKALSKTRDEYRAEMRPTAEAHVQRGLLLSRVVEMEGLRVEDAEIGKGIDAVSAGYGQQAGTVRKTLSEGEGRRRLELELLTQKALNRLAAIARREAPPLAEPAEASV